MPDRVNISRGVHPLYRNPLQQVCENQDAESIAISVIRSIRQDIKKSGKEGNLLITQVTPHLASISGNSLFRGMDIDWVEQYDTIDRIANNLVGDRFHIECAAEACRQILIRAENGEIIKDVASELDKERMIVIYKARVEEAPIDSYCVLDNKKKKIYNMNL